jgi:outer membrane protein, multidrug efflux system
MPYPIKLLRLAVLVSLATGCTILGGDFQKPQNVLPAQYKEADAGTINASISNTWWQLYQDALLNDLVNKALSNNADIKSAIAKIEQADASLREVGAALLPQVNLDAGASRSRITELGATPTTNLVNPRNNFNVKLGTSFELDFWGKLRSARDSARAQALSSRFAKDTVALSLQSLVVSNYLLLRSLDAQIAVSNDSLRTRNESLALTQRRQAGGVANALDVSQAQVAVANLQAQIVDLQRQRSITENQLSLLTGDLALRVPAADIAQLSVPPVPPAGLPSSLMEARPDVRQAEQQMLAANANIVVAKAALYPSITLTANLGGESLELDNVLKSAARIWTGGLSLNLPIFDSGRLNSKVDQATALQKQALASYEKTVQQAFVDVNNALVSLRQNTERELALKNSKDAAFQAMKIAENRYKSGYNAYLDVLDAQRVYNDAALSYVQTRQARLSATVDLFKALGAGWDSKKVS